jgi:uncharacterized protein involved in outer membrane biogenesis
MLNPLRKLKWLLLSGGALGLLAMVLLLTLDLGFLRGIIEKQAGLALGRELRIDDGLSIELGRTSVIEAHGLRLANPDWVGGGDFARFEHVYLELDTLSLWQDPLPTILELGLDGIRIQLIESPSGRVNWSFAAPDTESGEAARALPFLLKQAHATRADIDLTSPRLDAPLSVLIDEAEQGIDAQNQVPLSLNGQVKGEPMSVEASIGPWAQLLDGKHVRVSGTGSLGVGEFTFEGLFDNLWAPRHPDLTFTGMAPSLARLTQALGLGDWGDGEVAVEIATRPGASGLAVSASADIGRTNIELTGQMPELTDFENVSLKARAAGQNLGALARLAGYDSWPQQPFRLEADLLREGTRLRIDRLDLELADARLSLEGDIPSLPTLVGAELQLDFQGRQLEIFSDALGIGALPEGPFRISGQVAEGGNRQTGVDLNFELAPGKGHVRGALLDPQNFALDISVSGTDLALLKRLNGLDGLPSGPFQVNGSVQGSPGGTDFDVEFSVPPGGGHLRGTLEKKRLLALKMDMTGSLANRFGLLLGIDGLPAAPWALLLDIQQADASGYLIPALSFETTGLKLNASGRLGAPALAHGARMSVRLSGEQLAQYQAFAPGGVTLPDAPFSLVGTLAGEERAWLLENINLQVGENRLSLSGQIGRATDRANTRLQFAAKGRDFRALAALPGPVRLPEGPQEFSGSLTIEPSSMRLEGFRLEAGALNIELDAEAPWPLDFSHGRFRLDGRGTDITRVLPRLAGLDLESLDFSARAMGAWSQEQIDIEDVDLRLGETRLQLKGTLDRPPDASATDLILSIRAPNLSRLGTIDGSRWGDLPFDLDARLTGSSMALELSQMRARLGESQISGLFRLDLQPDTPEFDLKLSTASLNLRPFFTDGTEAEEAAAARKERLIPDVRFPLEELDFANGSFVIAADRLMLRRSTLHNNVISGQLRDGALQINELGTDTTGGRLSASLNVVREQAGSARVQASMHSRGLILDFSDAPREEKLREPPFDIDIELEGRGSGLRELAASMNGEFVIYSTGGSVVNSGGLGTKRNLLAQIVTAVSPEALARSEIRVSCFAAVGNVRNGLLRLQPGVALQSSRINTFSSGTVDLATEKLDLAINSRTRRMVDLSAGELISPFVKLTGTLARPSIGIDAKSTLITGGAAFLSGGLSLLARKAIGQFEGDNPCAGFLEEAGKTDR